MQSSSKPHFDLVRLLRNLDTGILNHNNWLKRVHRALVCGETGEDGFLESAESREIFDRWQRELNSSEIGAGEALRRTHRLHEDMLRRATLLFARKSDGQSVSVEDYEHFMDLAIEFKQELRGLQFFIVSQICLVDHLTGTWNRNGMHYRLAQEQERLSRQGGSCSICMMDFDHFKEINDHYGHVIGDEVLHNAMQFFASNLRKYDSIFRFGGEEFLICLPNTVLVDARSIIDRLRIELSGVPVARTPEVELHVTASFGVAGMEPGQPFEEAIEQADHALLCAKAGGRNNVCVWSGSDPTAANGAASAV